MQQPPPVALSISGSDCSAGAGLQADLKTFSRFGVHGLTVVTSVMSETALVVRGLHSIDAAVVKEQARVLLESFPVRAVKTGVLHSGAHVAAVAETLRDCEAPLVIDPAMLTATGESLLSQGAVATYKSRLFPIATLITPNLREACYLLGSEQSIEDCARMLHEEYGCAILVTGVQNKAAGTVLDVLAHEGQLRRFENPWFDLPYTYGTGCTLTSAITAGLARGNDLPSAIETAEDFVSHAMTTAYRWECDGEVLLAMNQLPEQVFGA